MTDAELLELIRNKPPDELSATEIEALRAGIAASDDLRREVALRMEMEQYLYQALARVHVSVDEIISQTGSVTLPRRVIIRRAGLAAAALAGMAVSGLAIVAIAARRSPPQPLQPVAVSAAETGHPAAPPDAARQTARVPSGPGRSETLLDIAAPGRRNRSAQVVAATSEAADVASQPWKQSSAEASDPASGASELYRTFDAGKPPFSTDDLKRWLAPVEGHRSRFGTQNAGHERWNQLEGLWRLKAPLEPESALRLTVWDWRGLKIHVWAGSRGATIRNLGNRPSQGWVGYTTQRGDTDPIPDQLHLAATDEDRYWKTNPRNPVTLQLRHADGLLTLSHGEIPLLEIPLSVAPTEVYFEGTAAVRDLAAIPAAALPSVALAPPIIQGLPPASQSWTWPAEGTGTLAFNGDGSIELRAEENTQPAVTKLTLDRPGIAEFVFELKSPQPGTGICLLDTEGNPVYLAAFAQNKAARLLQIASMNPDRPTLEARGNADQHPVPFVSDRAWIKLTLASGWVKLWVSADGRHFAGAGDPMPLEQTITGVGLFASAHESARSIQLVDFELHELDAINRLAPPALRAQANGLTSGKSLADFQMAADTVRPEDAERAAWTRACAVQTLARGCSAELGDALIEFLWSESARLKMPLDARLALLEQLSILAPSWNDDRLAQRHLRHYEELSSLTDTHPYSQIATRQMLTPIWSRAPFAYFPAGLARREALGLAVDRQWDALTALARRLEFFHFPATVDADDFYLWLESLVDRPRPQTVGSTRNVALAAWRHPHTIEFSKEGFNVLADLRVALESKSYRDACQVIGAANRGGMQGLLPDSEDADLSVSLAATVALAMDKHPRFRETMAEQFGPLGRLRVRQAIAARNAEVIEAATLQFYGTEAAAEAHLWLADRAISSGAFAAAQGHYRAARTTAAPEVMTRLAASEQLAAALLGHDAHLEPQGTVELGDRRIPATEITSLSKQLRTTRAAEKGIGGAPVANPKDRQLPAPGNYTAALRARFEGEVGRDAHAIPAAYEYPIPGRPGLSVDWVAEQMCVLPLEQRVLMSNRFQLASYDPKTGTLQWRAGLDGDIGRTHDWPLAPMRPLVTSELAFVRRLRATGPTLAALLLADGSLKWQTRLDGEHWVVSDPVLIGSTLYACTARHTDLGYTLYLGTFDPQTGVVLRERTLADLRETWGQIRDCQMLPVAESFVITCGGAVLRCNLMGELHWARKQLWIPPTVDAGWAMQSHQPPTLAENQLVVIQPCVPGVVALDPDNGRLLWRNNLTNARRILGANASQVFVATADGVEALDTETGAGLWQYPAALLSGSLFSNTDGLLIATEEATDPDKAHCVALTWLDTQTGQAKHTSRISTLEHPQPRFGPLFIHHEHLWGLYGKGFREPTREVMELAPE